MLFLAERRLNKSKLLLLLGLATAVVVAFFVLDLQRYFSLA